MGDFFPKCVSISVGLILGAAVLLMAVLPVNDLRNVPILLNKVNTGGLDQAVDDW